MLQRLRTPRFVSIAIFAFGAALLFFGAFHGNIWYDESYSIALARWDWADIWRLDALDVHPPLFYLMLHAVGLLFGPSVLAYRLFSVAGMLATAALGPTLVRRMWGDAEGAVFSAFILLLPNMQRMAWQIRMYSWAVFAATLCFLVSVRIVRAAKAGRGVPWPDWAVFATASLACAYLHYYGAIAVFLVNAGLLVRLLHVGRRHLLPFFVQAVVQIMLYLPWLLTFMAQVRSVSGGYWIEFQFPLSLIELFVIPFKSEMLWCDPAIQTIAFLLTAAMLIVAALARVRTRDAWCRAAGQVDAAGHAFDRDAALFGTFIYLGTIVLVGAVSIIMGQTVLMDRYMVISLGPLCVATSLLFTRLFRLVAAGGAALRSTFFKMRCIAAALTLGVFGVSAAVLICLYDPATTASVDAVRAQMESGASVLTDSGRAGGVLAALNPHADITYLDFTRDAWWERGVRKTYAGAVTSVHNWDEALGRAGKRVLFISERKRPDGIDELRDTLARKGLDPVAVQQFRRPYDRTSWTLISCMRS